MLVTKNTIVTIACDKCGYQQSAAEGSHNEAFYNSGWGLYPRAKKYVHVCQTCQPESHRRASEFVKQKFPPMPPVSDISAELKKDGMEKIREDYDLCMRDAFDKALTEPARAMALKMAKAYMAAMMTLDKSLHGIGAERGVMFVAEDLPFETEMTPFVSLRAIDLVELGKKVRSLCGNPHDVVNLVSYKGETHGFLIGGQGEGNVEVYRKRSVY